MANGKYLVVFQDFEKIVPRKLQKFVKTGIVEAFDGLDLELDFSGRKKVRDLVVVFSRKVPSLPIFGVSSRMEMNGDLDSGESTVHVGGIIAYRMKMDNGLCETTFPETEASLGSMIANTAIHETAHMLGLDTGGHDNGGHTAEPDNVMWDPGTLPPSKAPREPFFVYSVKKGDTLSSLVQKYIRGSLDPCRFAASTLTYHEVWDYPPNKEPGFIRDPAKGGVKGRRANDPNWIYPGEKIAFSNHTLRTQGYRRNFPGLMGKKTFTSQQIETMKKFIAHRLKAGLG